MNQILFLMPGVLSIDGHVLIVRSQIGEQILLSKMRSTAPVKFVENEELKLLVLWI